MLPEDQQSAISDQQSAVSSQRSAVSRQRSAISDRWSAIIVVCCAIVCVVASALAFGTWRDYQTNTRGIEFGAARAETAFGVNVALEQYADDDLTRALTLIRDSGLSYVRQFFYWNDLEPRPNEFVWDTADRLIARASAFDLHIVAVIVTTPSWARHPGEADLLYAPPANPDDYARFVAAFVQRYGDRVRYIQIWDNPNVHPFWGRRNADPFDYAALLRAAATRARAANPQVKILSAGLAPSRELIRGHPDYSDVLFLRGLYEIGAQNYFDIVGAKPYGMWSGPDDRRVDKEVFNFSRAILLRDEMLAYGDASKPIWAVEFGWNALPRDWRGAPSPWGTDTEQTQSARLADAIRRARREWAWMPVMIAQTFQPNAPSSDPVWGFALVDERLQPRARYTALTRAIAEPIPPASFDFTRFYATLGVCMLIALASAWLGARAAWQLSWERVWQAIEAGWGTLPELAQFALLVGATLALYYSPHPVLSFALLALLVFLFALRLDVGLAITVFTIPFYLLPKKLFGNAQFSMVELLVLVSVAAWIVRHGVRFKVRGSRFKVQGWRANFELLTSNLKLLTSNLKPNDVAVIAFVLLGLLSVKIASNFGVAIREFRVIVLEPALLYALIRASNLSWRAVERIVYAFVASAVAVSLIGVYQFLFTDWVIVGEGVRRVLAVYGSPNNLALYLERALPLALLLGVSSFKFQVSGSQFSVFSFQFSSFLVSALVIALALYLTYSRGAWMGIVAGLAFIALGDRRARIVAGVLLIVGIIAVIPFLQTERAQSLFQIGTGTGFFRVSVWDSALRMIRDHPILGVGLDNFLYEYPKYINPEAWREPNLSHPHNVVLDFWVRLGIAGVVVLAWMLFEFYRQGVRASRGKARALAIGLMASMTAALAHGLIDAAYFYVDLAFVWMMTLGVMVEIGD
jgi:O-antigen ligase